MAEAVQVSLQERHLTGFMAAEPPLIPVSVNDGNLSRFQGDWSTSTLKTYQVTAEGLANVIQDGQCLGSAQIAHQRESDFTLGDTGYVATVPLLEAQIIHWKHPDGEERFWMKA